jgi:RNA polymerase primary sigma factor
LTEASTVVSRYLSEIRGCHPLSREQERDLSHRVREGHRDARDRLVEANLGFVVKVAKEYRNLGIPFEDLLNEGNLGLLEAARRFDADKGTKFITCAIWWIRKAILAALDEHSSLVRLPGYQKRKLREARAREADAEPDARTGAGRGIHVYSMDATSDEGPRSTFAERLTGSLGGCPEGRLISREAQRLLDDAVMRLPEQERQVIVARFGLAGEPVRVLKDLGREMGLSRERVRQIEQRAIGRLQRLISHRQAAVRRRPLGAPRAPVQRSEPAYAHAAGG